MLCKLLSKLNRGFAGADTFFIALAVADIVLPGPVDVFAVGRSRFADDFTGDTHDKAARCYLRARGDPRNPRRLML